MVQNKKDDYKSSIFLIIFLVINFSNFFLILGFVIYKKVVIACESNNKAEATVALNAAVKAIDMACTKGVFHKNNASRKKSRLAKLVNKIAQFLFLNKKAPFQFTRERLFQV